MLNNIDITSGLGHKPKALIGELKLSTNLQPPETGLASNCVDGSKDSVRMGNLMSLDGQGSTALVVRYEAVRQTFLGFDVAQTADNQVGMFVTDSLHHQFKNGVYEHHLAAVQSTLADRPSWKLFDLLGLQDLEVDQLIPWATLVQGMAEEPSSVGFPEEPTLGNL